MIRLFLPQINFTSIRLLNECNNIQNIKQKSTIKGEQYVSQPEKEKIENWNHNVKLSKSNPRLRLRPVTSMIMLFLLIETALRMTVASVSLSATHSPCSDFLSERAGEVED